MVSKRIIPCLDIKDGRTVKGVNFVGLQDAGDPRQGRLALGHDLDRPAGLRNGLNVSEGETKRGRSPRVDQAELESGVRQQTGWNLF